MAKACYFNPADILLQRCSLEEDDEYDFENAPKNLCFTSKTFLNRTNNTEDEENLDPLYINILESLLPVTTEEAEDEDDYIYYQYHLNTMKEVTESGYIAYDASIPEETEEEPALEELEPCVEIAQAKCNDIKLQEYEVNSMMGLLRHLEEHGTGTYHLNIPEETEKEQAFEKQEPCVYTAQAKTNDTQSDAEHQEFEPLAAEELSGEEEELTVEEEELAVEEEELSFTTEELTLAAEEIAVEEEELTLMAEELAIEEEELAVQEEELALAAEELAGEEEELALAAEELALAAEELALVVELAVEEEALAVEEEELTLTAEELALAAEVLAIEEEELAVEEEELTLMAEELAFAAEEHAVEEEELALAAEELALVAEELTVDEEELVLAAEQLAVEEEELTLTAEELALKEKEDSRKRKHFRWPKLRRAKTKKDKKEGKDKPEEAESKTKKDKKSSGRWSLRKLMCCCF